MRFTVCSWNVNGIHKLKQFFSQTRQTVKCPDVICLQETWAATPLEQFSIINYAAFHADVMPSLGMRAMGGVSTYFWMDTFVNGRLIKLTLLENRNVHFFPCKKWTLQGPRGDFATRSTVTEVTAWTLPNGALVGKPLNGHLKMTPKDVLQWTPQGPFFRNLKKLPI
jgi:hypothetical protein